MDEHNRRIIERILEHVVAFDVTWPLAPLIEDIRGTLSAGDFPEEFTAATLDLVYGLDGQDDARQPPMPTDACDDEAARQALIELARLFREFLKQA